MKLFQFSRRLHLISFPSSFNRPFSSLLLGGTLHEESAGGLNGRFARIAHSQSPSELIAFYRSLGPSDRSHLSPASYNYILAALLRDGQQMEAFRLISQLESSNSTSSFPDKETFTVLIGGLVEADPSGSLAMAVDELFELMRQKHSIQPDSLLWSLRIRAFLHQKFLNPHAPTLEPARIFYSEMCEAIPESRALPDIRSDLIVTAVSRRLWSFAEWLLGDSSHLSPTYLQAAGVARIANAPGLFLETASIPVLRFIIHTNTNNNNNSNSANSSNLKFIGFNECLLVYCWRQGQVAADLALTALRCLIQLRPHLSARWIETAEGCLQRQLPRDYYTFDADDARNRLLETVHRLKCPQSTLKALEDEIKHQKLVVQ